MAGLTRTGTFQSQSFIMEQISKNNARYVKTQEQITTGQKTQRYTGLADQAAMTVNLANSKDTLKQYDDAAKSTSSRLDAMHSSLSNIIDVATKFRAQLLQAMTAEQADDGRIDTVADGYLQEVEAALNTDLAGVYLFGGTKNTAPPVDLSDPINNADGLYYSGSGDLMQSRIDGNTVLQYGATADRQGFKDIIASIQRVSSGSASLDQLETALDELNSAIDDLTQLEAEIGHQMDIVERAQTRNQAISATVTDQLSGLRDVDVSAAMVELTQRQTILQASYLVISRGSQLTLTNYL
jgi:flagellar hook-associated protein 3 FlgL